MSKLDELIKELCTNDVEHVELGEIGKFYGGLTGKSKDDFSNGNAKFITYKNVYANPSLNLDVDEKVKISDDEKQRTLQYGDIIFTGSSETPNECGLSSVITVKTDEKLYLNSFSFFLRLDNKEILLPDFSKHLFRSPALRYQIGKTASGVTRFNVSKKLMEKVVIPVPPLPVQREVVRILDNFTELMAELTAELTARKKQYEYYKNELFNNADNIELLTLDMIAENCDSQRRAVSGGSREFGNIPYYGASGIVDYVKDYIFDGNYLLISEDGANLLARTTPIAFSISGKTWVNNHAHVLRFDEYATRRYIEMYLNSIDLTPYITGVAQPKLSQKNLNSIKIPLPPLSEQQHIIDILDRFDILYNDISNGLLTEIKARQQQYENYRDKLLIFPKAKIEV